MAYRSVVRSEHPDHPYTVVPEQDRGDAGLFSDLHRSASILAGQFGHTPGALRYFLRSFNGLMYVIDYWFLVKRLTGEQHKQIADVLRSPFMVESEQ